MERSAVGRTVRWADGAALGNTDGGRSGVGWSAVGRTVRWADADAIVNTDGGWLEWSAMVWTVKWADGAALGTTDGGRNGEERRGVGS